VSDNSDLRSDPRPSDKAMRDNDSRKENSVSAQLKFRCIDPAPPVRNRRVLALARALRSKLSGMSPVLFKDVRPVVGRPRVVSRSVLLSA